MAIWTRVYGATPLLPLFSPACSPLDSPPIPYFSMPLCHNILIFSFLPQIIQAAAGIEKLNMGILCADDRYMQNPPPCSPLPLFSPACSPCSLYSPQISYFPMPLCHYILIFFPSLDSSCCSWDREAEHGYLCADDLQEPPLLPLFSPACSPCSLYSPPNPDFPMHLCH